MQKFIKKFEQSKENSKNFDVNKNIFPTYENEYITDSQIIEKNEKDKQQI